MIRFTRQYEITYDIQRSIYVTQEWLDEFIAKYEETYQRKPSDDIVYRNATSVFAEVEDYKEEYSACIVESFRNDDTLV